MRLGVAPATTLRRGEGLGAALPRAPTLGPRTAGREVNLGPGREPPSGRRGRPLVCALGAFSPCSSSPSLAVLHPRPAQTRGSRWDASGPTGRFPRGGAQSPISFLRRLEPGRRQHPLASDPPAPGPALRVAPAAAWAAPGMWAGWRRAWS